LSTNLYARAQHFAKEAVEADDAGKVAEAFTLYLKAADILVELQKFTSNPRLSDAYERSAKGYVARAKTLKGQIKKKVPPGKGGKSDDGDDLDDSIEDAIVSEKPDVNLSDVAGLEDAKTALREAIVLPLLRPDLFTGSRQPWRGILLHGPPGCGKTLIAKATAGDVEATFFNISAATLVSKWLGESEKLVKKLYEIAKEKQPSIIFIDEVDSLTQSRGDGENDAMRRVKTQLLSSMEGLSTGKGDRVVTIGATNVPWDIDSAFRRRFQRRIYVSLPSHEAREIIFNELADITESYSGSDIANVCKDAVMAPIRELDQTDLIKDTSVKARPVRHQDYLNALENVNKSVSAKELIRFEKWDEEFGAG
jgi:vacuolar protein-sorting-associated protein 4